MNETKSYLRIVVIVVIIVALAIIGAVGFFVGRDTGLRQVVRNLRPAGNAVRTANITRLPPKRFDSWTLACVENAQKTKRCDLVLNAVQQSQQGGQRRTVMSLIVGRDAKGQMGLSVITPPSAVLPAGLHLTLGSNPQRNLVFLSCGPRACEAHAPLDNALEHEFSSSDTVAVAYVAANGRNVGYKIPLKGFSEGYPALLAELGPAPAASGAVKPAVVPSSTSPAAAKP